MKWVEVDTKVKGYGQDIIFVDGKYYLSHNSPNGIAYSEDLINWKDILLDNDKLKVTSLAYGNGTFLITGGGGNSKDTYVYVSQNGIDWNLHRIESDVSFSMSSNTCKFLNNQFVFITGYRYANSAGETTAVVTELNITKNGKDFSKNIYKVITNNNYYANDIDYGNGLYVLIGDDGFIATSPDLKNWEQRQSGVSETLVGISYGKGLFVITGADGIILTSKDGISWEKQNSNTTSYLVRSRYANGIYIAVGYNGTILSSIDGKDWYEEEDNFKRTIMYGLVYSNNQFVVSAGRYSATQTIPITYSEVSREIKASDEECLYVYNKNLELLGIVEGYISLTWHRKYFEAGEFMVVVIPDSNNVKLLCQKDNIIMRNDYTEAGIIEVINIEEQNGEVELTVTGRFLSSLFERRIIKSTINFSGKVIEGMKTLIAATEPLCNNLEIESTKISSLDISFQCTYKNLYSYLVKLSKFSLIGFRLVPNVENKVFIFENYIGKDRTHTQKENDRYCFSDEQRNIDNSSFIYSSKTDYNYALVGGVGEGSERILEIVKKGENTGFNLREIFVDAKNQSNQDISDSDYRSKLVDFGKAALTDDIYTFEAEVYSMDYQKKWDLGDIVDIQKENWGILEQKIISEIVETRENQKIDLRVVLGSPIPEVFGGKE